ncbi:hypothetical protein GCM10009850_079560 [Nonomuraea monospora]|uniref:Uncharacterized protein n=1 Tax=Nonomuraea monospora TaxID=568818 RepID=A0ABN3CSS1_9ACTN
MGSDWSLAHLYCDVEIIFESFGYGACAQSGCLDDCEERSLVSVRENCAACLVCEEVSCRVAVTDCADVVSDSSGDRCRVWLL